MKEKKVIVILFAIFLFAQSISPQNTDLPLVIGPSPETAQLQRYIQHSVDHSTGAVSLTIPIYEIKKGVIQLPISIGYYTTGRRHSDETGALGIGWSLNLGGISLTRTVYGRADELIQTVRPETYMSAKELRELRNKGDHQNNDEWLLYRNKYFNAIAGMYTTTNDESMIWNIDSEYDIFKYSIPGYSGSFILGNDGDEAILLDNQPVKISMNENGVGYFTIIDDKGIKYGFVGGEYNEGVATAWVIKEIVSADGQKIVFDYVQGSKNVYSSSERLQLIDNRDINISKVGLTQPQYTTVSVSRYSYSRLKSIDYGFGRIDFKTDSHRDANNQHQAEGGKITDISIRNSLGNPVQKISFSYSKIDNLAEGLSAITKKDMMDNAVEKYIFRYFPSSDITYFQKDYWGYVNNNKVNKLLPAFSVWTDYGNGGENVIYGSYSVIREPDLYSAKQGILSEIIYPTGGSERFEYESNKGIHLNNKLIGGGVRLKCATLKSSANSNDSIVKEYKYGPIEKEEHTGYGFMRMNPKEIFYDGEETYHWILSRGVGSTEDPNRDNGDNGQIRFLAGYRQRIFSSDYGGEMALFSNMPIFYSWVSEYINGQQRIDYLYEDKYRNFEYSRFGNLPSGVTSKVKSIDSGLSISIYSDISYLWRANSPFTMTSKKFGYMFSYWNKTNLLNKIEYVKSGNTFIPIKKTKNYYKSIVLDTIQGLKINQYFHISGFNNREVVRKNLFVSTNLMDETYYADYYITIGKDELIRTEEEVFSSDLSSSTKTITEYYYNDRSMLTETKVSNSNQSVHQTSTEYVADVPKAGRNTIVEKMYDNNLLNYVVRKTDKVGDTVKETLKVDYRDLYQIGTISSQRNGGKEEVRIVYHNYDNYNNPIYITKDDAAKIVYLWGYLGQYPIAEIRNATYTEVETAVKSAFGVTNINELSSKDFKDSDQVTLISKFKLLREHASLKNAMVTGYTYKPLVGMTSVTDPSGKTTYYEYDNFSRLKLIRNHEGDTTKLFEYHNKINLLETARILSTSFISSYGEKYWNYGEDHTFSIEFEKDPGQVTYLWEVEDKNGNVKTYGNSSSQSVAFSKLGKYIVRCKLEDKSGYKTIIETNVNSAVNIGFSNEVDEYKTGKRATIVIPKHIIGKSNIDIYFRLEYEGGMSGAVSYDIAGETYLGDANNYNEYSICTILNFINTFDVYIYNKAQNVHSQASVTILPSPDGMYYLGLPAGSYLLNFHQ